MMSSSKRKLAANRANAKRTGESQPVVRGRYAEHRAAHYHGQGNDLSKPNRPWEIPQEIRDSHLDSGSLHAPEPSR